MIGRQAVADEPPEVPRDLQTMHEHVGPFFRLMLGIGYSSLSRSGEQNCVLYSDVHPAHSYAIRTVMPIPQDAHVLTVWGLAPLKLEEWLR